MLTPEELARENIDRQLTACVSLLKYEKLRRMKLFSK
jgi:hypothetical protein